MGEPIEDDEAAEVWGGPREPYALRVGDRIVVAAVGDEKPSPHPTELGRRREALNAVTDLRREGREQVGYPVALPVLHEGEELPAFDSKPQQLSEHVLLRVRQLSLHELLKLRALS